MKVLIAGHVTHDFYDEGIEPGGCAFYGAKVHHAMEGRCRLATVVGEDFQCSDSIAQLEYVAVQRGETTAFANYYPEDGPRQQLLAANAPEVEPDVVDERWLSADVVHLAPVCGEVDLSAWKQAVGDGLLAINVQGWLKQPGPVVDPARFEQMQSRGVDKPVPKVVETPWEVTREELAGVDVACLSEEDLIGQTDLLERLVDAVEVVALTRGAAGSRIYVAGKPTDVDVVPADVVDPTGAGDVFAAAFVNRLGAGSDPVEAARGASAAASVVIEDIGARALWRLDAELQQRRPPTTEHQTPTT